MIALVGFMGAGKTSVGQALAKRLKWEFLDLDRLIEERESRSIEKIFAESGEQAFRALECRLLGECLDGLRAAPIVLALGGGAFAQPEVRRVLREARVQSVFLDAGAGELFQRSQQAEVIRPLRRDLRQFEELYERRRQSYSEADLRIDTSSKEISLVVEEIISALVLVPSSGVNG